jgi:hypothetical protein
MLQKAEGPDLHLFAERAGARDVLAQQTSHTDKRTPLRHVDRKNVQESHV